MCVFLAGILFYFIFTYYQKMVPEKCPIEAADQYDEKHSSPNTLYPSPSPSMIS